MLGETKGVRSNKCIKIFNWETIDYTLYLNDNFSEFHTTLDIWVFVRAWWQHFFYFYAFFLFKEPDNQEIQVQNLRVGSFLEDEESNTFSVNFTWEPPPFKFSTVRSYTVSYELYGGYSREELSCPPLQMDSRRLGCSKSGDVSLD